VSPTGRHLVSGNRYGDMYLYAAPSGALLSRLAGHTGGIYLTRFSPDGRRVFSFSADGSMRVWAVPAN
jgi:WD40 repeat protein